MGLKLNISIFFPIIYMDKSVGKLEDTYTNNAVHDSLPENIAIELDVAYSRLKRIGKDKFQVDTSSNENILSKIKSSSQYFNLNFPSELHEYFINIEDAPLFWVLDSPLMGFLEEIPKSGEKEGNKGDSDQSKLVKEYYSKWVTTLRSSEKKYFAQSLLKTISKEKNKTIVSSIFAGVLYSFDETLRNPDSAQESFEQAEMLVSRLEEGGNRSELLYIIKVFSGFEHYRSARYFEASQKFRESLLIKSEGITAKFYLSICEIILGNISVGFDFICDVYDYDLNRMTYALANNNFPLFQFFLKNPFFQHVFKYKEFAPVCSQIDDYLQGKELGSSENLNKIRSKLEAFRELHLNEYQEQSVKISINFFEKVLKGYFTCPLNLFLASVSILWDKFNDTLQFVFSTIRQRFLAEVQKQLRIYDQNVADLNILIEHLTKEIADFKAKYKERVKISIAHYEVHVKEQTEYLERKLHSLSDEKDSQPAATFKSSLSYTIILSALVVLIAGFASYSSNYSDEMSGFGHIVKAILVTGGKWGIITFIIGFFISSISTVYTVYERSLEKQKIIREISSLKQIKEKNIEHIRADAERNERITVKNLTGRIEHHKKRIKEIGEERIIHEEKLSKEIEEKIKEEANKLIELLEKE